YSVNYEGTLDKFINQYSSNHQSLPVTGTQTKITLSRQYHNCLDEIRRSLDAGMYGNAHYGVVRLRRIVMTLKLDNRLGDALNDLQRAINSKRAISNEEVKALKEAVADPSTT
ncbi:hypothetical protein C7H19_24615, partial [Aphanothece hegewaldii CCALA 016]